VRDVYEDAAGGAPLVLRIEPPGGPGIPERARPVIYPPKVFAVFVPEHLDRERDFKIGAHWVYVKLRDSSWTEEAIDREPAGGDSLSDAAAKELKSRLAGSPSWKGLLVPYHPSTSDQPKTGK
jgi:hypothetical protein